MAGMLNEAVVRRTERWFVRQGMPQLIAEYRFRRHVLPRMLPVLPSTIVVSLTLAALVARIGPRAGAVAITVLVVGLGAAVAAGRHRAGDIGAAAQRGRSGRAGSQPVVLTFSVDHGRLHRSTCCGCGARPSREL
jgi:hypothetical protein